MSNLPATGSVLHYAAKNPVECHRAVVEEHIGTELMLRIAYTDALGHFSVVCPEDPHCGPNATDVGPHNDFTAGTWHETH